MRRAAPLAILLLGGVAFLVIGLIKDLGPENKLYHCDEDFDCRVGGVLGPVVWPWYLAGALCLVAAGAVVYRRRQR